MAEEQIENDEIDSTEAKANAIGKEIGVEDDKDIPDYDIQEEDDERVAKEREPRKIAEKKKHQQLTTKEKRDLRKKRIYEKFSEKDAEIERLSEENQQMKRWQQEVNGRLSGINKTEVDKAFNETVTAFTQAEKDHADAFAEGDGVKATKAMRVMYDSQRRIEQLQGVKTQLDKQPEQVQSQPQVDREVVNKAKEWAKRNAWYDASGKDTDSAIAKAISGVLANEGYDPKSDDFWDELDERLAERSPDKLAVETEEDEDEPEIKPRKRATPPVNGGANRGDMKGKKTITLPTSYINMLKANGIWDDVSRRNKIIAEREKILKESRA